MINSFDLSKHGPLQIVHDFKFAALNVKDDYSILDTLDQNGKLDYIKSRIDRLHRLGYGGLVMNVDYNDYLKNPPAFHLFFEFAHYAKEKGLQIWIYDEQYYPSGAAGGIALLEHPELEAISLACVAKEFTVDDTACAIRVASPCGCSELKYAVAAPIIDGEVKHGERVIISDKKDLGGGLCFHAPNGKWQVWCFFIRPLFELTNVCQGTRASRRYISILNKKAVERFYKVTFEDGYCAHFGEPLSRVVDAVFTDEPYTPFYKPLNKDIKKEPRTAFPSVSIYDEPQTDLTVYPYIPWELGIPERYKEKYGRDILLSLPDIFEDTPYTKEARIDFYTLISDMAKEAFPEQLRELLHKDGVALSGHYFAEEGFDYHPLFYGDLIEHLCSMSLPGCDSLWSDTDVLRHYVPCKLASSAAHLASKDKVMIEASNMVDRDQSITPTRAKAAISVMFAHGVNVITSYYGENLFSEGEMREFTKHISSLGELFDGGKYRINTLLYYPFENLCADRSPMGVKEGNYIKDDHLRIYEASTALMKRQVGFDFINKRRLLSCELCDGCLKAPNGERVEYIVFPSITWLDAEVAEFVAEARRRGVTIIFDGAPREIDGLDFTPRFLSGGAYPRALLSFKNESPQTLVMERAFDGYELFLLVNTETENREIEVMFDSANESAFFALNHETGERSELKTVKDGENRVMKLQIPALDIAIIGRENAK